MITIFYGDQILPSSPPVLVFPMVSNQIELAINTNSTIAGTTITGSTEGVLNWLATTDNELGTPTGFTAIGAGKGAEGNIASKPIAGQLANLNVQVSKDGAAFAAGIGTLGQIASGYYKYTPDPTELNNPPTQTSSTTGTVVFRIFPTDPRAVLNTYIEETMIHLRLRYPGNQIVNLNPGQASQIFAPGNMVQPMVDDIKNFMRSLIRDILGNQLTTKPTFRKD